MTKRTIVAIFLALAFILLSGTVFHWVSRQNTLSIRKTRIKKAYEFARKISVNAHNGFKLDKIIPELLYSCKKNKNILFFSVTDLKGNPKLLKSRLSASGTPVVLKKMLQKEQLSTVIPDGIVRDPRPQPSVFHYAVGLDRENKGSLLILFNPATYRNNRSVNIRRFVTAAVVILLFTMLYLLIMNQVKRTGNREPVALRVPDDNSADRDLEYLKSRNSLLEKEVESLSSLHEKSIQASTAGSAADLLDHLNKSLEESFGDIRVRILLDRTHSAHSLNTLAGRAQSLENKKLRAILDFLPGIDVQNSSRMAFPLSAGKTTYGIIIIRKRKPESQFNDADAYNASRLISQQAVPLYNFLLYETAVTDALTGLYNRRHFDTRLKEEVERSVRYKSSISLVMIDIDFFKTVNDTYGHSAGDAVLTGVSRIIQKSVRKTDYAFRYGGEEIAILMPETGLEDAADAMESLRRRIAEAEFPIDNNRVIRITCSFGVSESDGRKIADNVALIRAADSALYASKKNGRNMVSRNTGAMA